MNITMVMNALEAAPAPPAGLKPAAAAPARPSRLYTEPMRSVGADLRARTVDRVLAMPVRERIALALALGDEDLELFARSSGLDRAEALRRLRDGRRRGRHPSRAAGDAMR